MEIAVNSRTNSSETDPIVIANRVVGSIEGFSYFIFLCWFLYRMGKAFFSRKGCINRQELLSAVILILFCGARLGSGVTLASRGSTECELKGSNSELLLGIIGFLLALIFLCTLVYCIPIPKQGRSHNKLWHWVFCIALITGLELIPILCARYGCGHNDYSLRRVAYLGIYAISLYLLFLFGQSINRYTHQRVNGFGTIKPKVYENYGSAKLLVCLTLIFVGTFERLVVDIWETFTLTDLSSSICDTTGPTQTAFLQLCLFQAIEIGFVMLPAGIIFIDKFRRQTNPRNTTGEAESLIMAEADEPPNDNPAALTRKVFRCTILITLLGLVGYNVIAVTNKASNEEWLGERFKSRPFWLFLFARIAAGIATLSTIIAMTGVIRSLTHVLFGSFFGPYFAVAHDPLNLHRWSGISVVVAAFIHMICHFENARIVGKDNSPLVYHGVAGLMSTLSGITGLLMIICLFIGTFVGLYQWWHLWRGTKGWKCLKGMKLFYMLHYWALPVFLILYVFHGFAQEFNVFPLNATVLLIAIIITGTVYLIGHLWFPPLNLSQCDNDYKVKLFPEEKYLILRFHTPFSWVVRSHDLKFIKMGIVSTKTVTHYHSFSLAFLSDRQVEVHISEGDHDGWTRTLFKGVTDAAKNERHWPVPTWTTCSGNTSYPSLCLEGPYNGPFSAAISTLDRSSSVVLLGNGSGVGVILTALRRLLQGDQTRRIEVACYLQVRCSASNFEHSYPGHILKAIDDILQEDSNQILQPLHNNSIVKVGISGRPAQQIDNITQWSENNLSEKISDQSKIQCVIGRLTNYANIKVEWTADSVQRTELGSIFLCSSKFFWRSCEKENVIPSTSKIPENWHLFKEVYG